MVARLAHDVGDPERPADLHELTPADDSFLAPRKCCERDHDRRGVVVDGHRRLGACELAQQCLTVHVTAAALTGSDVVLERRVG
jgi:hypothetical protein